MKRITTKSGAAYLYDEDGPRGPRLMRAQGDMSTFMRLPNDSWADVHSAVMEVGQSGIFLLEGDYYRITTPIQSIEDAA